MLKNGWKRSSLDLGSAVGVFLFAYGAQLLFQAFVLLLGLSVAAKTWTIVIGNQLVLFAVSLAFCFVRKVDPLAVTGVKRPPKWYFFPLFLLIAVACVATFGPLSGIVSKALEKLGYEYEPIYYIPFENKGRFALAFLALTLLPVLGEEFTVRGVLFSGGKERSPFFAIFYTALIFALMHGNLRQLVHQFLLGAVMGYLVWLTGSIYPSAVLHIANNGFALLLEYGLKHGSIDPRAYWYVCGEMGVKTTMIGVSVGLFGLLMLLVLVTCLIHRERSLKKDFIPTESSFGKQVTAYLRYLGDVEEPAAGVSAGEEARTRRTYSTVMAIILAVVLAGIIGLTLIPGV